MLPATVKKDNLTVSSKLLPAKNHVAVDCGWTSAIEWKSNLKTVEGSRFLLALIDARVITGKKKTRIKLRPQIKIGKIIFFLLGE